MRERPPRYSLRTQGGAAQDVDPASLRKAFNEMLSVSNGADHCSQAHHAFYGDLLLKLVVVEHLEHKFDVLGVDRRGMSDHECSQFYVTASLQAAFFDSVVLQTPAAGNPPFTEHVKADKVEMLISYLDWKRGAGSAARKKAKCQLDTMYRWLLQRGDDALHARLAR